MKILIVTATRPEMDALGLTRRGENRTDNTRYVGDSLSTLVTGVGIVATTWALMDYFAREGSPGIIINAGIAGSYNDDLEPGNVVVSGRDTFAELGVEDGDGFKPLWEIDLPGANGESYKTLDADNGLVGLLEGAYPAVNGVTVNRVTGSEISKQRMIDLYDPVIETMETAAVYWVCKKEGIRSISVRSVSNRVAERDRSLWDIKGAFNALAPAVNTLLHKIR